MTRIQRLWIGGWLVLCAVALHLYFTEWATMPSLQGNLAADPIIAILHSYPGAAELDAYAKDPSKPFPTAAMQRLIDDDSTFGIYPRPAPRHSWDNWEQKWFRAAIWGIVVPLVMLALGGFFLLPRRLTRPAPGRAA
jgi:hypothetical protein